MLRINSEYQFVGEIRAIFPKKSGIIRCVVEDENEKLFIMNLDQLQRIGVDQLLRYYDKMIDHAVAKRQQLTEVRNDR